MTEALLERTNELRSAVETVVQLHDQWAASDATNFPDNIVTAMDDMFTLFETGMIPDECRKASHAIQLLVHPWNRHWAESEASDDRNMIPNRDFWGPFDLLRKIVKKETASYEETDELEPIKQLELSGCTDFNICILYGWYSINPETGLNVADFEKLREERKKPGTYTGKNFVHPKKIKAEQDAEVRRKAANRLNSQRNAKVSKSHDAKSAPETLERLAETDVSVKQAAKILGRSEAEIRKEADEKGLVMKENAQLPDAVPDIVIDEIRNIYLMNPKLAYREVASRVSNSARTYDGPEIKRICIANDIEKVAK